MGTNGARDASDETLMAEAAITARIDRAVASADFSDVPLPDFSTVTPDPHRVLEMLAARTGDDGVTRSRLAALLEQRRSSAPDETS